MRVREHMYFSDFLPVGLMSSLAYGRVSLGIT